MRSPATPANLDDSEDSDNNHDCYLSDFYHSDDDSDLDDVFDGAADAFGRECHGSDGAAVRARTGAARRDGGEEAVGPVVPPWSELETAVQALMGMDQGVDLQEDGWNETESAR